MRIIDYGGHERKRLLFFPAAFTDITWYEDTFAQLQKKWHLYVVVYDGYEPPFAKHFTSVEQTVNEVVDACKGLHIDDFDVVYGLSMGGAMANRLHALAVFSIKTLVLDGAITPYQLPKPLCRLILWRDYEGFRLLRKNPRLLQKMFPADHWLAPNEEASAYYAKIQTYMQKLSLTTIWRSFDSCNNYAMPQQMPAGATSIFYLYGAYEKRARAWDRAYIKRIYPQTTFVELANCEHGELAMMQGEHLLQLLKRMAAIHQ